MRDRQSKKSPAASRRADKGPETAAAAALALLTGGCSNVATFFGAGPGADEDDTQSAETARNAFNAEVLSIYLQAIYGLVNGDPAAQAGVYQEAADAVATAPTITNRLRFALVLATPGHPWSDGPEAQRLLSQLLTGGSGLMPDERVLATMRLKEVEQRLMLDAEAQQLRAEVQAARAQQDDASARRLAAALDENRQLREELDDALERLDAIATIEQSIRERENGSDSP